MIAKIRRLWSAIRRLSGDDAYERYLAQHQQFHPEVEPLSREAFFKEWQDGKWKGVKRCC
jgi:uncharacterized short protein YbdD (DUF466 family)